MLSIQFLSISTRAYEIKINLRDRQLLCSMAPSTAEIKNRLQSTVMRSHEVEQGDIIYGVTEFNNNPSSGSWASGGKTFTTESYLKETAKKRAENYFYTEQPLRKPDMHDTVLYKARVAIADSRGGRDTAVVDPQMEVEVVLTDINIIDRRKPGESL